jgi:hypothetical protein
MDRIISSAKTRMATESRLRITDPTSLRDQKLTEPFGQGAILRQPGFFIRKLQQVPVIFDIGIGRIAWVPLDEAFSSRRSSHAC